ncbi:MAG TPA: hypothetical protein VKP88_02330 [Candidatus Paceibacterota bacterium]|nr:hypothetical protein [Candidatus Paceibacterota bacterium]
MENLDMNRRGFIKKATAALFINAVNSAKPAGAEAPEQSLRPPQRPPDIETAGTAAREAQKMEFYEEFAGQYQSWSELTGPLAEQYFAELDQVVANGSDVVAGDGRIEFEFLRAALALPNFAPAAAEEIRRLLPALGIVESRMRSGEVNERSGAAGILQFMRKTWDEHGEGDILDIRNQVAATDSLLEQKRLTLINQCQDELDTIKDIFFAGDDEAFQRDFYAPVILSCFNAGGGNVRNVVQGFFFEFTDRSKVEQYLIAHGINPTGRDVFALMVQLEEKKNWDTDYGRHAREYVLKVWAAREALNVGLSDEQRAHLLGELPDNSLPVAVSE